MLNTNIKRWSVGSPIQAPLDSLLELIRTHALKAADVEHVEVRVSTTGANTTDNRHIPDICMQHMVACMLLDGIVTFESAHDEARMQTEGAESARNHLDWRSAAESDAESAGHRRHHAEGRAQARITPKPCAAPRRTRWRAPRSTRALLLARADLAWAQAVDTVGRCKQ
jgi:2-methylcitrate dehydratase PrpD